jgi:hypothetical protein
MDDLPKPSALRGQLAAGEIELIEAVKLILEHLAVLYQYKQVDLLLLNGLLRDMAAVTAELNLERPSAVLTDHLKALARQVEARDDEHQSGPSEGEAEADVGVASSTMDEG